MESQAQETQKKASLLSDTKFRWLIFSLAVVGVFELLSLAGWHLPPAVDLLFFAVVIIVIGHRTLASGLRALTKLKRQGDSKRRLTLCITGRGA